MVAAIKYFHCMLKGRRFTIFTDQRPLVGTLSRHTDPWTGPQQHHFTFIAEISPTIHNIAGTSNMVWTLSPDQLVTSLRRHLISNQEGGALLLPVVSGKRLRGGPR
jgi:hypothetical protein